MQQKGYPSPQSSTKNGPNGNKNYTPCAQKTHGQKQKKKHHRYKNI
jgi:hypothetical protein